MYTDYVYRIFLSSHQEKSMKILVATVSATIATFCLSMPAKAELDEIRNPSWQEVPGTTSSTQGYESSAYVDSNGIIRNGDMVTYDMVNPDASYNRVEANCRTNQFRATRHGYFESATRVSYTSQLGSSWDSATEPYDQALLSFVCNL